MYFSGEFTEEVGGHQQGSSLVSLTLTYSSLDSNIFLGERAIMGSELDV